MLDYMDEILTLQQSGNDQLCTGTCINLVTGFILDYDIDLNLYIVNWFNLIISDSIHKSFGQN